MSSDKLSDQIILPPLLEAAQVAYLKKDFVRTYELTPALIKRIIHLMRQMELMMRVTDYNEGAVEPKKSE